MQSIRIIRIYELWEIRIIRTPDYRDVIRVNGVIWDLWREYGFSRFRIIRALSGMWIIGAFSGLSGALDYRGNIRIMWEIRISRTADYRGDIRIIGAYPYYTGYGLRNNIRIMRGNRIARAPNYRGAIRIIGVHPDYPATY
jgi:hypothetical protein